MLIVSQEHSVTPEPFVSADAAAAFLSVNRRMLLSLARKGIAGAYPLGTGKTRHIWVFRLSELVEALRPRGMIPIRVALAERLFMAYQQGSIRKVTRKNGEVWVLRFRENTAGRGTA